MSKFNLFDEKTWQIDFEDVERKLSDKALGTMGSAISKIKDIKTKIEEIQKYKYHTEEYSIARELQASSPEAFAIMDIKFCYPDDAIGNVLNTINSILDFWAKGKEFRYHNWKNYISNFYLLKDFLSYDGNENSKAYNSIGKITVSGNAAWNVYLRAATSERSLGDVCERLTKSNEDLEAKVDELEVEVSNLQYEIKELKFELSEFI